MMDSIVNMEKPTDMFEEFLTIYKFLNKKTIVEALQNELNINQLKEIYNLTNGVHSTRDIARMVTKKCGHVTIARLWKQWTLKGLAIPMERKGRVKVTFNLDEHDITQIQEEE